MKWRVKDPSTYYNAAAGSEAIAGQRLAEIVKDGIKSVIAQRTLQQIVSAERAAVTSQMFGAGEPQRQGSAWISSMCACSASICRMTLRARVYENMKQSFAKIANRLRAEGQQEPPPSARPPSASAR